MRCSVPPAVAAPRAAPRRAAPRSAPRTARRVPPAAAALAGVAAILAALAAAALAPAAVHAQERDSIPGVSLGLIYESTYQPVLALKPFAARVGGGSAASQVEAILGRDLRYSDRFRMLDSVPAALLRGEGIDYRLWDQLGAVWLLSGSVEGAGEGYVLVLRLHDVVYGEVREEARFRIPSPASDGFRMAVHRVSDRVVEWIFDEPGMAASRIAFSVSRPGPDGRAVQELYTVDSDGENLRRVTGYGSITMSPAWAPDGSRLAFTSFKSGEAEIYELDLASGRERRIETNRSGQHYTPAYHPDGRLLAFSVHGGRQSGIYTWDVDRDCCLTALTGGRWDDLSPTFSPDGGWIAFNSNRLGVATPQIYGMSLRGSTEPDLLSPYLYGRGGYFTSPEWSPLGDRIAFHGRIERGRHHILVTSVADRGRGVRQLTWEGNNEDPSWAPDGRHIVFVGERREGTGLLVVDGATGRIRTLVEGLRVRVPAWSPSLGEPEVFRASDGGP